MIQLNVYLSFNGTCEEALNFYKDCLGGEIVSMQRFKDTPVPAGDAQKDWVMHAEFRAGDIYFMASDVMPDQPVTSGNAVSLSLNVSDLAQQEDIFKKLSKGGHVLMPLQETFWGAKFGMLADRFGNRWLLNCELKKA